MKYGSICSGIEAATVAWHPLGWEPVFFSEIEPYPCALLKYRYPSVPNLGDMTKIRGEEWRGKIDVLVGGTPCQAFSVAGARRSLNDARGNLSLVFTELIHAIDPRYVLWENVPGVLSTKDNAFGCFLAGVVGSDTVLEPEPFSAKSKWWSVTRKPYRWRLNFAGGWDVTGVRESQRVRWPDAGMVIGPKRSAAWRILDAQYFGLAQRRRRVFVVSCRTGDGINPGAVLFEPESVRRDSPPSREAGQGSTAGTESGAGGSEWGGHVIKGAAIGREPQNGPQYGEVLTDGTCYTLNCTEVHAVTGTLSARTQGGGGLGTDFDLGGGASTVGALTSSGRGVSRTGESRGQDPVIPVFRRQ